MKTLLAFVVVLVSSQAAFAERIVVADELGRQAALAAQEKRDQYSQQYAADSNKAVPQYVRVYQVTSEEKESVTSSDLSALGNQFKKLVATTCNNLKAKDAEIDDVSTSQSPGINGTKLLMSGKISCLDKDGKAIELPDQYDYKKWFIIRSFGVLGKLSQSTR